MNIRRESCGLQFIGERSQWTKVPAARMGITYLEFEKRLDEHTKGDIVDYRFINQVAKALGVTPDKLVFDARQESMRHYYFKALMKMAADNEAANNHIEDLEGEVDALRFDLDRSKNQVKSLKAESKALSKENDDLKSLVQDRVLFEAELHLEISTLKALLKAA